MQGAISVLEGRRTVIHFGMAGLLVLGAAACGEDEFDAATAAGVTTAAPARQPASAPATTYAAAHAETTTSAAAMLEESSMENADDYRAAPAATTTDAAFTAPAPSATTFRDYQQSRFVRTSQDRTSTFSLDTDRASFQLALNWARQGYEVDPDSVRAEEWINAFSYGYEHPRHPDSFAIVTDLVRHPLDEGKHLARIGFQAPEFRDDRPLNVTLVLDASGSMREGNRVAIAREAAESIRLSLRSRDRIAVVHFTEHVIDGLTVGHLSPDDQEVRASISHLAPHGSTNVQAGLDEGVRLADQGRRQRPDAHNYIILMSDGVANVDATDPFAILESAYDPDSGNPLRLITIGVGISNYNDHLLEQLAQYGNGWYRYLSDTEQARSTFSRDSWLPLSVPFADQTRAQVTWNDEVVSSWRMIGYENRITPDASFVEDRKEFAEIPVGAATTVFYELELTDRTRRGAARTVELADVDLRWVTPVSSMSNRQSATLSLRPDVEFQAADPLLQFGAVVALASDRYASLPFVEADAGAVGSDLWLLMERLRPLGDHLGGLDSFNDFAFLLDHIAAYVPAASPDSSGYSR